MDGQFLRLIRPPFPQQPDQPDVQPPMVYVTERTVWEYHVLTRDLDKAEVPTQTELNELGKARWELTGILTVASQAYFYFKRLVE
jgi:hypothetical protein